MNDETPTTPVPSSELSDAAASPADRPADASTQAAEADAATQVAADDDGATSEAGATEVDAEGAIPSAHPVLVYTGLRIAVLAVVGGILWLVGLRGVYLILLAFLVSGVISAVALSRRREGAAYGITKVVSSANARLDASSRAEDIDDSDDFDPPTTDR